MKKSFLFSIVAALCLVSTPALAQLDEISLDSWDFNQKAELIERMNQTQAAIDEKIDAARETDDFDPNLIDELKQASADIESAITDVQQATEEDWTGVLDSTEDNLMDYEEYGVYDEGFWDI